MTNTIESDRLALYWQNLLRPYVVSMGLPPSLVEPHLTVLAAAVVAELTLDCQLSRHIYEDIGVGVPQ